MNAFLFAGHENRGQENGCIWELVPLGLTLLQSMVSWSISHWHHNTSRLISWPEGGLHKIDAGMRIHVLDACHQMFQFFGIVTRSAMFHSLSCAWTA